MPTLKPGYPKTTTAVKTASGKDSAVRAIDPKDAVVVLDDSTEVKVVQAVTEYVLQDTAEKAAKEAKEASAEIIRAFTSQVREENAIAGEYQKSLRVLGKEVKKVQYAVDASHQDKFTVPTSKDDIEAIKKLLGTSFETLFEETVEISIKKTVMENDALRKELSLLLFKALGSEGIKKYFDRDTTWKVKKGIAETQYMLDKTVRESFQKSVKQTKDSLKDASGPIA